MEHLNLCISLLRHSPHHPPCQSPRFPSTDVGRRRRALENPSAGYGNLSPLCPPPPNPPLWVGGPLPPWPRRARGPYLLRFPGPEASPPCAGQRGAGTQTGVTTAPKAASLCSSRSRDGTASPRSSPPTPEAAAAGAPPSRLAHTHNPLGLFVLWGYRSVTQLAPLQSEGPQVASPPCGWSLPFSGYLEGSATPSTSPTPAPGFGFFCFLSSLAVRHHLQPPFTPSLP